ncbi:MAG TPA: GAF domain-containing sensor histidine kinase [Actinomycetota bacterium]|nr:GAF domain-containing sensor histidine kinase [Actinomycetota bacterium]
MSQGREPQHLEALVESAMALAGEHELDVLLARIATLARTVVGASYAAIGVVRQGALEKFLHSGMDPETVHAIGDLPTGQGVLGVLLTEPTPLRMPEVSAHSQSAGFPAHHPVMHSFLGVPIVIRGRVYGRLYLTDKHGAAEFSADDERLAAMLAAQAGSAIERSELFEQLRVRGEELSQRLAQLASVDRVGRLLVTQATTDQILRSAASEACSLTNGTRATVMLADAGTEDLIIRQAVGGPEPERLIGARIPPGTSKSGAVMSRGQPERVDNLPSDPEMNEAVRRFLGNPQNGAFVPLQIRDRAVGALAVYGQAGGAPFSDDDLVVLQMLGNQVAAALENERLTALLREMAVLEERERISRELHDGVIQAIYSVGLSLQGSLSLIDRDTPRARIRIDEAIGRLDDVVRDVRNYIFELRPHVVVEQGGLAAIEQLAKECEVNTLAQVSTVLDQEALGRLGDEQEASLIQIVREILSNVARHSQATEVRIALESVGDEVQVVVEDNGSRYDPATVVRGQGLTNIESRAAALGAQLEIASRPEGGMRHVLAIPVTRPA